LLLPPMLSLDCTLGFSWSPFYSFFCKNYKSMKGQERIKEKWMLLSE